MEEIRKPPYAKPGAYFIIPLLLASLIVCVTLVFVSLFSAQRYTRVSAEPLMLKAQIVAIEENSTEDSVSYDAIMRYMYQGAVYDAVYQSFSSQRDANSLMGTYVTAVVDPQSPEDTLYSIKQRAMSTLSISGVVYVFAVMFFAAPYRKRYVSAYGWRMEMICRDILQSRRAMPLLLVWPLCFAIIAVFYKNVFLNGDLWGLFLVFPLVFTGIGLVGVVLLVRDCRLIQSGAVILRRDAFVKKRIRNDGEDGQSYLVTFTNGAETWEKPVSAKTYAVMREGDRVDSAYLGNRKKPSLSFYHNEEVF